MNKLYAQFGLLILCLPILTTSHAEGTATQLFSQLKEMVYQIRVIDIASGDKSVIGSGFRVSNNGHLATNFHVVSPYVHKPESYRLEFVYHDGSTGEIQLLGIDVIHDLAIVKSDHSLPNYFRFNKQPLSKGDRIYSMGNPHDLGMTIIEGNYNGFIKTSRYQNILFSGSLNAGMSGGPAMNANGDVIGVNVSKSGEQLSFLVSVTHLDTLLSRVMKIKTGENFQEKIGSSLLEDQDNFYKPLLSKEWPSDTFMELTLPGQVSTSLKCWGHTLDDEDILYEGVHQHCQSQDKIYISGNLSSGSFSYDYEWMSTKELNQFQFYHLMESRYTHNTPNNARKKEDITNYECQDDFIHLQGHSWRISSCFRAYKKYSELYDALLLLASVDGKEKGVIIKIGASGISQENARGLFKKMMESIRWPH